MKKIFIFLSIFVTFLIVGCGNQQQSTTEEKAPSSEKQLRVGIVLSVGGLGDKSFNDEAYLGLEKAKKDFGISFKYESPSTPDGDEMFLREFAEMKYDLVIATGSMMQESLEKVAKEFPETKFAIIDATSSLPNVASLVFAEDEGSFLVGALAGMMTKTNQIGFVGGMDIPVIQKFKKGYEQGALYANPNVKVNSIFVSSANPFNDSGAGKVDTIKLIDETTSDVVYHAAGGSGEGVIDAAKEKGIYAIGVDSNQDGVAQGTVLTSMLKKVNVAVYNVVRDTNEGNFKGRTFKYGVKDGGVDTTTFEFTKDKIGEENLKKLNQIRDDLINDKIKIQ